MNCPRCQKMFRLKVEPGPKACRYTVSCSSCHYHASVSSYHEPDPQHQAYKDAEKLGKLGK